MMRTNRFKSILAALFVAVLILGMAMDASSYAVKQIWARFSGTAGEALVAGDVVCLKDTDGYIYKADANDTALRPAVGIIGKGGASGAKVEVIVYGIITGWTTLAEGGAGYLSETAGAITQSSPTWSQQLGYAISTTDYLINCQNYFDSSALTTLGVLSGATPLVLEGATADAYETTVTVTDPTADRTQTLPDASGAFMLSPAGVEGAANSVYGVSNGIGFEGATADAYETTVTVTDPTADRTITLPDATGTVMLGAATSHDYSTGHADWTMTAAEAAAGYITIAGTVDTAGANAILPAAQPGKLWVVNNASAQTITFKVTGQSGTTVATNKYILVMGTATDVLKVYGN